MSVYSYTIACFSPNEKGTFLTGGFVPQSAQLDAIIGTMLRTIFREALILLGCLTIFPAIVVLVLIHSGSLNTGMTYFAREMFSGDTGPGGISLSLWFKFLSPYLVIQSLRAYWWAQGSLTGRRWANLFFFILLSIIGGWSFVQALDLLYFMYALGDIPAELFQFLNLESSNLIIALGSLFLAVHCFRVFLNPRRKAPKNLIAPPDNAG